MFAIVIVIVGHRSWPCLPVWMPRSAAFRHFDIETLNHNFVKDTRHAGPDSRDTYIYIYINGKSQANIPKIPYKLRKIRRQLREITKRGDTKMIFLRAEFRMIAFCCSPSFSSLAREFDEHEMRNAK